MARGGYKEIPMIVDSVVVGLITMRTDVIERFTIPEAVVNFQLPGINRKRKAHERKVYISMNEATATGVSTNVKEVIKTYTPFKNRTNSGKKIKLDTGLRSVAASVTGTAATAENAGTPRLATVNFPNGASNYQIARWIRGLAGIRAKWDTMQSFVKMLALIPVLWGEKQKITTRRWFWLSKLIGCENSSWRSVP